VLGDAGLYNGELQNLYTSQHTWNVQVKEDEMGREFSTLGREEACTQGSGERAKKK
jgi:hypothetical protein